MSRQSLTNDIKRIEEQTGTHLLIAGIVSAFSILLIFITFFMSWELWTIPLILIGISIIWFFHIGKFVSGKLYEYNCIVLIVVEFFYYGIHPECLFDIPIIVIVLFFLLALLDRKGFLYVISIMYALALLYHLFFLHTLHIGIGIEGFMRLLFGISGTFVAGILSSTMVSRRKEERKKMYEMAKQLEAAKQKNAEFLSNVSHELRTPINMVTGISEIALGKELTSDIQEGMQSIQLAGKRLAGQINDILDYTELVGNTLVVTKENYMPCSIINDMLAMAMIQNRDRNLEIIFDLEPRIPAVLIGDAEKISRVIRILVQNAIKFTEEGGVYVYIGFRKESYGINLNITVSDTGIGMTSFQLSQIYDDFYQADSGKSRYTGGLGLGIPIARGLLHAMDGFIHYESIKDKGTQVHVSIPQKIADDTQGMEVANAKAFCVICYFKQEKYTRSEVRQFYDNMIMHMAEGLNMEVYRVYHFEDLETLMHKYKVTHLFLSQEEYKENISYYEELGRSLCVALIVERRFTFLRESSLILLYKPFFALSVVNLSGGMYGGTPLWFVFVFVYISLLLNKTRRILCLLCCMILAVFCNYVTFHYPIYVSQHTLYVAYLDSVMSIILVGALTSVMILFQKRIYQEENRISIQQKKEIEELSKAENHFFSSMSHEIRTPINTIIGLNEMILRDNISDEVAENARNIQGASKMLLTLINDILDLSKIESGKMDIINVPYETGAFFSDIINMIWIKAKQKNLEFHLDIDSSIPSMLCGDEVRIKQILINILNNSVKYTKEGSVTLSVRCERKAWNQVRVHYSIRDTGQGVKKEDIPYLFNAFQRVDEKQNRHIEGTGLGLSIVK